MSELPESPDLRGRCLCGGVQVTLHQPRDTIEACHCTMCRQWASGAYLSVSSKSYTVSGEEHVRIYRSSRWAERAFCCSCGSTLWYQFIPGNHRSFSAGLFELPASFRMTEEIFVNEKPTWYDFSQDTTMKTGPEILAEAKAAGYEFD